MEDSFYSDVGSGPEQEGGKRRKYWTKAEEDACVAAVKELVVNGWRSGNGWRPGFYKQVAARIRKQVPGSDVVGDPHVLSKIGSWKKDYNNMKKLFGASGQGVDPLDYSIPIVGSEQWSANVRVNPDLERMRGKSYPYYEDWKEMFGNDRANGSAAHDFGSTREQIRMERQRNMQLPPLPGAARTGQIDDLTAESDEANSAAMTNSEASSSRGKKRKNKGWEGEERYFAMMESYMKDTKEAMSDLSKAIISLNEVDPAVTNVFGEIEKIPGLTMVNRVNAARKIAASKTDVVIFFSMTDEAKKSFVESILM